MNTALKIILSGGCALFIISQAIGQTEVLQEKLRDKTSFSEITQAYEEYFRVAPESEETKKLQKQFARWAWYTSFHLGAEGEFVNTSRRTLDALNQRPPLPPERAANGNWLFLGPNSNYNNNPVAMGCGNGRADRIAFHPTNSSIIYVGTPAGGLWKTTNGGSSWTSLSDHIPSLGISGIVVSHNDPNTIFVLTGDGDSFLPLGFVNELGFLQYSAGVLVSHDGGLNWQMTGLLDTNDYVGYCLVQHPTNANILLAGTSEGMYRTADGGDSWDRVYEDKICDIEFKPGAPSTVYACGIWLFIKSTDTGENWSGVYLGYPNGRNELAVTPAAPEKVFMLSGPALAGNTFAGFWVSTNSGESFTKICSSPNVFGDENGIGNQSSYDIALAVKPTDASKIIIGGLIIYKSINGGTTFTPATTYWESGGNYIHPDVHAVAYNPLSNILYAATDGGFYRSLSDANTWTDYYTGLNTSQFYHIDDYNANPYTILGGCQDNGVNYRAAATSQFSHISSGDGFDCAINYTNQYKGFVSVNDRIYYYSHFTQDSSDLVTYSNNNYFPQIELNVSNPDLLYYSFGTVKSYNRLTNTNTTLGGSGYWALKTCTANSQKIYAAGGSNLFSTSGLMHVSINGGSTWVIISDNTGFPDPYPKITDIAVNPGTSLVVSACFGGYTDGVKVVSSTNSGQTWTNISYDLPNVPVWCIEVDNGNNMYVGTDIGVYYRENGASAWEPFYNNIPNVPISDLAINTGSDQLMAATFGRGIWSSTLQDPCPTTYAITSNISGRYFKAASSALAITSDVVGGEGTNAVLRAGNYVDLLAGFQVDGDAGNKFKAYTGPCEPGLPADFVGQYPIYPEELLPFAIKFTRHSGTLEIVTMESDQKQVIVRLFEDGDARIILATAEGEFIRDIASFQGKKDLYTYDLDISGLKPGMYYLYLVVNDQVEHLQELDLAQ